MRHVPVLLNEVLEMLDLKPGMRVVDATLGDAGHSEQMLERIGPGGTLIGIDADPEAILRAKKFLHEADNVHFIRRNFSELKDILAELKIDAVDAILMDLGWSTPQFEQRGRGFSFDKDEPLDMRFGPAADMPSAADLLEMWSVEQIEEVLREYGEEKLAREIAEKIKETTVKTSTELAECALKAYREKLKTDKEIPWIGGIHPATKTFQALRIAVNDELGVLKSALTDAIDSLAPNGRLAVISFHSLEDRIVKHTFKSADGIEILTKKPIVCTDEEKQTNPPSRSAKLRVVKKYDTIPNTTNPP